MRRVASLALAALTVSGGIASAQAFRDSQGPVLIPPSPYRSAPTVVAPSRQPTVRSWSDGPVVVRRSPGVHDHSHDADDPIQKAVVWHGNLFGRRATSRDVAAWEDFLRQGGRDSDLLASMLASDEYFQRNGGTFDRWFLAATTAATAPVDPYELPRWREIYRRTGDRYAFMQRYLDQSGVFAEGHDHHGHEHGAGYGQGYAGSPYLENDYYGSLEPEYDFHGSHGHGGHVHTAGYRPTAPSSPPELIAGWYRTFHGREIRQDELNKWMNDLNKGMPLEEVYASVLGGDEWYIRTGSDPTRWVASTLEALGQRPDGRTLDSWLDRLRRRGDRYQVALDMVRTYNAVPGGRLDRGVSRPSPRYVVVEPDYYRERDRRDRHDHDD